MDRIGVNPTRPKEFINTVTGRPFFPEGNNYVRVTSISGGFCNSCEFNVEIYDQTAAENALSQMQRDGYNVVRIFIQFAGKPDATFGPNWGIGGPSNSTTPSLSPQYLNNIKDFLLRANQHRIYVIPVLSYVPFTTYYQNLLNSGSPAGWDLARFYLLPGGINAKTQYVSEFVNAIPVELRSTIFAYELENEVHLCADQLPFNLRNWIATADGRIYNLAIDVWRQECMDSNLVNWANTLANAIRQQDSRALVSASVFT